MLQSQKELEMYDACSRPWTVKPDDGKKIVNKQCLLRSGHPGHLPMPSMMELNCRKFLDGSLHFCAEASARRGLDNYFRDLDSNGVLMEPTLSSEMSLDN